MNLTIIACGIIIYFMFREWARRSAKLPLERLTPEQIAELHRIEMEARTHPQEEFDFKIWYLRAGLPVLCGFLMFLVGMLIRNYLIFSDDNMAYGEEYGYYRRQLEYFTMMLYQILTVVGVAAGALIEFVIELRMKRKSVRAEKTDN